MEKKKSMEKNSVRNLQYGPKTRLIRGIYCIHAGHDHSKNIIEITKK